MTLKKRPLAPSYEPGVDAGLAVEGQALVDQVAQKYAPRSGPVRRVLTHIERAVKGAKKRKGK